MREKFVCRRCEVQSVNLGLKAGGRRPFAIEGAVPHYAPDRPFKLEHIFFDLNVDPRNQDFKGSVTQRLKVIAPHQDRIVLDQVGLLIDEVKVGKEQADFSIDGNSIHIFLKTSPAVGTQFEFTVRYRLHHPRRGIYFIRPDSDYPNKIYQVWTQGQDEDSRHWFPTLDYPNQKATTEMKVTVPRGFTAVSNGALLSKQESGNETTFHYRLGMPQVTYLVSLVISEFSEWADTGPNGLDVRYYVPKGREEDGKRAFGNTPLMIEAFEKKTGVPYPYEKYSQVAVQDFIFGGMENTSATTQTDLTLHDARAHLDFSSDALVAHELAHQWFGDLVTCRDWSHGWLNEGFATFLERVWIENDRSSKGGFEEAKYSSYQDWKEYLSEDHGKYRRPIVCNTYIEPIDLFDMHLYQKGGLVLNLLRSILGEDLFWQSVQVYLTRHRGQNVETLDLIRAIEETTGRNLRRFFDEWVFNAGYPEFEVSYRWHEDKKMTEWVIEQKQTGGAPSVFRDGATTHLFHLPVVLQMNLANGEKIHHRIELGEARDRIFLPVASKPMMVRFDPHFTIPKKLKFPRPKEMLLYQLKNDEDCMGRIEAIQELSQSLDYDSIKAIGEALAQDRFWGVQAEAAQALAEIRTEIARDALIDALQVPHPKARREVVTALGRFTDARTTEALKKVAEKDESYFVEAEATYAWASSAKRPGIPLGASASQELEKFLLVKSKVPSYRDVICSAALRALSELSGVEKGDQPRALNEVIQWTVRGRPTEARVAAIRALGKVLKKAARPEKAQILEVFSHLASEDQFRIRMQLVGSIAESGCAEAIPILAQLEAADSDGRVKRGSKNAIHALMSSGEMPETVNNLKSALDKLEEEYKKLRSRVEEKNNSMVIS